MHFCSLLATNFQVVLSEPYNHSLEGSWRTCKGLPEDSFKRLVITVDCDVPPERKLVEFLQCVNSSAHFVLYLGVSRLGMGESTAGVCHWFPIKPFWLASHWIARALDGLQ